MKLIKNEKIDIKVNDQFIWSFDIVENGVYIVSISARCKNWLQNYKQLFNDDDLAIQIDDYLFAEIEGKKREFSSSGSWNGNEIKGNTKNVLFILPIKIGSHQIKFWVDGQPILEKIIIYKIDEKEIDLITSNVILSNKFLDIVSNNLKIEQLEIKATAEVDSKLEIKIDGKIQKNSRYKRFEKWYWYGQELKGKSKVYTMSGSWDIGLHSLELNGQGKHGIESIKLKINKDNLVYNSGFVKLYKDIVQNDSVNLRLLPTDESESLAMLSSGEKVDIINERVVGKYIVNYSDIWHEIITRGMKGYILSSFVEIGGQEREKIIFKIKEQAKTKKIDPDFAVALAGCESRYKTYALSSTGAKGIFQLTSITRIDLEERFDIKISEDESFEVDKNITAGLTYLKWLCDVYKGVQDEHQKITAAWNAGQSLIPINGQIIYEHIKNPKKIYEVKSLVNCVEQNRKSKNWKNIVILSTILLFGVSTYSLSVKIPFRSNIVDVQELMAQISGVAKGSVNGNTKFIYEYPNFNFDIKSITVTTSSPKPLVWFTNVEFVISGGTFFEKYSGALYSALFYSGMEFRLPTLVIVRGEGQSILTSMLEYNDHEKTLLGVDFINRNDVRSNTLCCSYMLLIPQNNAVQYDIGMPDFSTNPPSINVYKYNYLEKAFVEQKL